MSKRKPAGLVVLASDRHGTPPEITEKLSIFNSEIRSHLVNVLNWFNEMEETVNFQIGGKNTISGSVLDSIIQPLLSPDRDENAIGTFSKHVFKDVTGILTAEYSKSMIFRETDAPWGFDAIFCLLFESSNEDKSH